MKIKERALSLLLSLVMVLTFMPALTFAEEADEPSDVDSIPTVEEPVTEELVVEEPVTEEPTEEVDEGVLDEAPEITDSTPAKNTSGTKSIEDWYVWYITDSCYGYDGPARLVAGVGGDYNDIQFEYQWVKGNEEPDENDWTEFVEKDDDNEWYTTYSAEENGDYYIYVREKDEEDTVQYMKLTAKILSWDANAVEENVEVYTNGTLEVDISGDVPEGGLLYEWYRQGSPVSGANTSSLTVNTYGYYECIVSQVINGEKLSKTVEFYVHYVDYLYVYIDGLDYELNDEYDESFAGVWNYDSDYQFSGNVSFRSSVTLSNGKTYPVTTINTRLPEVVKSVNIPSSITEISGLGYAGENYDPVPGFTIFGTTGSYAQTYANQNGFAFRDLAAEAVAAAEAARQGTPGSLPSVKASKPKAAKKAITVKWKKLKKKQLKSGVSNIEVWVCSDGAFANGSTIERVVGKKKASLKIKGLQKGVTYYVKVRAITYSGGAKIVGPWSAVKKVKVKK